MTKLTKYPLAFALWASATVGSMNLCLFAGYSAINSAGRDQAGWGMILFFSIAVLAILVSVADKKANHLAFVLAVFSTLLAIAFSLLYFFGEDGVRELLGCL